MSLYEDDLNTNAEDFIDGYKGPCMWRVWLLQLDQNY